MSIWNEGLTHPEVQALHKLLKLNLNYFLEDILLDTTLFKVEDKGNYYNIYPLFYCDQIETDGDAIIDSSYKITCKKDYEQIFMFISNIQVITEPTYRIKKVGDSYIVFIYDERTLQPLRNSFFLIEYINEDKEQYITDKLGYCIFQPKNDDFKVIL